MFTAELDKQIMVTVNNRVGTLAQMTRVISSSGINMIAVCAYAVDNRGIIMFVSEDNEKAEKLLKAKNYDVRTEEVILVTMDNKPGTLQTLTERIAKAGIDLTLLYGSVTKGGKTSSIVLVSEDNQSVLTLLTL